MMGKITINGECYRNNQKWCYVHAKKDESRIYIPEYKIFVRLLCNDDLKGNREGS